MLIFALFLLSCSTIIPMECKLVPMRDWMICWNQRAEELSEKKTGRWIIFCPDSEKAAKTVKKAVRQDYVHEAKYVRTGAGPMSFYLEWDDEERHGRLLSFLADEGMLPKKDDGTYKEQEFYPEPECEMPEGFSLKLSAFGFTGKR